MELWLKDYYGQHARLGELAVRLQKGLEDGQDEAALISVLAGLMAVLRLHRSMVLGQCRARECGRFSERGGRVA